LFDMHVHLHDESFYPLFLMHGITTIREMGNTEEDIWGKREKVNSGEVLGPRMYIAGPILEGSPPLWDGFRVVDTEAESREAVRDLSSKGVDFIKVYETLKEKPYKAAIQEAAKHGLKVVGHIPYDVDIIDAITLGQVGIEHMVDIATSIGDIKSKDATSKEYEGWSVFTNLVIDKSRLDKLKAALEKTDSYICPTFTQSDRMSLLSNYEELKKNTEGIEYLSDYVEGNWKPSSPEASANIRGAKPPLYYENYRVLHEASKQLLLPLAESSTILAGSDTPNPFVVPGFSLIRELETLVECGLKPYQALEAATHNGAKFFDALDDIGTIEEGKIANMVLLSKNPLDDISA
ncbi:MAG: amidohydrolase family protein, partial [Candidatus Saccharimonadales bacterium]